MSTQCTPGDRLPRGIPIYGFFALPRGLLVKVCAEPCMFAPGYIQSNKPRWPSMHTAIAIANVTGAVLKSTSPARGGTT